MKLVLKTILQCTKSRLVLTLKNVGGAGISIPGAQLSINVTTSALASTTARVMWSLPRHSRYIFAGNTKPPNPYILTSSGLQIPILKENPFGPSQYQKDHSALRVGDGFAPHFLGKLLVTVFHHTCNAFGSRSFGTCIDAKLDFIQ